MLEELDPVADACSRILCLSCCSEQNMILGSTCLVVLKSKLKTTGIKEGNDSIAV
jgi:hypothetical protein